MEIVLFVILVVYLTFNALVCTLSTPREMARMFWTEQNWIGKVAANIFYAPAWAIAGIVLTALGVVYFLMQGVCYLAKALIFAISGLYEYALLED